MVKVPRMVQLKKRLGNHWSSIHTYMGEFGGETPKPTRLWSNHKGIRNLVRTLNPSKYEKSNLTVIDAEKKAAGIAAVTGSKNELKMSQAYPMVPVMNIDLAPTFLALAGLCVCYMRERGWESPA